MFYSFYNGYCSRIFYKINRKENMFFYRVNIIWINLLKSLIRFKAFIRNLRKRSNLFKRYMTRSAEEWRNLRFTNSPELAYKVPRQKLFIFQVFLFFIFICYLFDRISSNKSLYIAILIVVVTNILKVLNSGETFSNPPICSRHFVLQLHAGPIVRVLTILFV